MEIPAAAVELGDEDSRGREAVRMRNCGEHGDAIGGGDRKEVFVYEVEG